MNDDEKLKEVRARIDALDEQIQTLITERAVCAQAVAHVKRENGESSDFYRPEREAEVLRKVLKRNKGPLTDEEMARLFREIMSACLAIEEPLQIAYLGPEGTFTQAAALKHFGHSVNTLSFAAIDEVFREVEADAVHYGVVPVENSTEGVISHTLDTFMRSSLKICGEVALRIHHHLLGNVSGIKQITKIYSHQQTLAQCREWLDANLPGIERVAVSSNAEAARQAAAGKGTAAIASEAAAQIYGLESLYPNIEDEPDNMTRFLVIGRQEVQPSGADKTSILVSAPNKPGALHTLLQPFARHNISMTRIESRPSRQHTWDYVFFVDIEGHRQDKNVARALEELEAEAPMLKILGSYPKAVL